MKFEQEVAVITGGTTGIGSATCTKLQQEGAIVYNLDIHDIGADGTIQVAQLSNSQKPIKP